MRALEEYANSWGIHFSPTRFRKGDVAELLLHLVTTTRTGIKVLLRRELVESPRWMCRAEVRVPFFSDAAGYTDVLAEVLGEQGYKVVSTEENMKRGYISLVMDLNMNIDGYFLDDSFYFSDDELQQGQQLGKIIQAFECAVLLSLNQL